MFAAIMRSAVEVRRKLTSPCTGQLANFDRPDGVHVETGMIVEVREPRIKERPGNMSTKTRTMTKTQARLTCTCVPPV